MNSFESFWPVYIGAHRNRANRWIHVVATLSVVPNFLVAWYWSWWWLLAVPVMAYGLAWFGHLVFEGNRPATFGHPLWSLRGDLRMCALMLAGQMDREISRVLD